jgi:hypothetical protein
MWRPEPSPTGGDAAGFLSRKAPPHPRLRRDLSRNEAVEAKKLWRGTQHPSWGEVFELEHRKQFGGWDCSQPPAVTTSAAPPHLSGRETCRAFLSKWVPENSSSPFSPKTG